VKLFEVVDQNYRKFYEYALSAEMACEEVMTENPGSWETKARELDPKFWPDCIELNGWSRTFRQGG
jgi:hypothetical protein